MIASIRPESQTDDSYASNPPVKPVISSAVMEQMQNAGHLQSNDYINAQADRNIVWNPACSVDDGKEDGNQRPELSREHWQMSPADCTQGLGMDLHGTDIATMLDAGWQVRLIIKNWIAKQQRY